MKFFSSALLFTVLNYCLVFARPNDYRQSDDKFYFWITTSYKATIKGLSDRSIKNVVIPQYFVVDGERYYVDAIGDHAFGGYDIKSVTIPNTIEKIEIDALAFEDCKKLEVLNINAGKVIKVNKNAFRNANVNLVIKGSATPAFTKALAKEVLNDFSLPFNKDYTNVTQTQRKKDLYTLAKKLNAYITFDGNKDQGNAAVAFAVRHASWGGISRAYYQLALAMGIKNTEILIGGDYAASAWNYVKVDGKWYNVDVSRFEFKNISYTNAFFKSNSKFIEFLNQKQPNSANNNKPSKWVVVLDLIHYQGESNYNGVSNLNQYLDSFDLGSRA